MKTAISIPDPLFEEAERLAERLDLSRSALYRCALEAYLREYRDEVLVERINEVCEEVDTYLPDDLSQAAVALFDGAEWEED